MSNKQKKKEKWLSSPLAYYFNPTSLRNSESTYFVVKTYVNMIHYIFFYKNADEQETF